MPAALRFAAVAAVVWGLALAAAARSEAPPAADAPPAVDIPNAVVPAPGVRSGGQPSEAAFEQAAAAGYRTVINLRVPGERGTWDEEAKAAQLGMRYLSLPIAVDAGLNEANARRFAELLEEAERPVLLHCGSGNRIGAMFALKAFYLDGLDAEAAIAVGLASGLTRLEPAVRARLAEAAEAAEEEPER